MYYINDSITSITTEWLSQLLQKVETNKPWSWGEAEKSGKKQNSVKNVIVVQIYWTHVCPVRPPVGAPRFDWVNEVPMAITEYIHMVGPLNSFFPAKRSRLSSTLTALERAI